MSAALKLKLVSVEDYLAGELASPTKHEYLGGYVYAMAGARNLHNLIGGNILATLHFRLRGKPCRPFNSDTKIRVQSTQQVRFYYPEVSVICRQNPLDDSFQDQPVVIFEVLSESTRRIDLGEKKDAYLTIPSLMAYVVVEQDAPEASVFRRTNQGFVQETYLGMTAVIPLAEIGTELPFSDIYESVEFIPEQPNEALHQPDA